MKGKCTDLALVHLDGLVDHRHDYVVPESEFWGKVGDWNWEEGDNLIVRKQNANKLQAGLYVQTWASNKRTYACSRNERQKVANIRRTFTGELLLQFNSNTTCGLR